MDNKNKSFKVIDLDDESIYNINTEHKKELISIKKIIHPKYGESLLSSARDNIIKFWTIK